MEPIALLMMALTGVLGLGVTLWGGYYLLTGLMSWRPPMDYGRHPKTTRFAVLIAARNEELVIGPLINSLLTQDYPAELYDVWVIPNNCADNTAQAARQYGANVLECTVPVKSKGEVLRFAHAKLSHAGYDAFCVFDADNIAHPAFLAEMNNAYHCGARVAQGYRDSKNPHDSAMSGCYSIYYWMMDRFHNGGKAGLGLSAMVNGTGFMVASSALDSLGGWRTKTISEDIEISALCALSGIKIHWVPKARTFDEQPLGFAQSVVQRKRWTSGTLQVAGLYLPQVAMRMLGRPTAGLLDLMMTLLIPAYQVAALFSLLLGTLCTLLGGPFFSNALLAAGGFLLLNVASTVLGATLAACLVLTVERKWNRRIFRAVGVYWLFLLSWVPITVGSFWKKTTVWEEIRHTRNVAPEALAVEK